MKKTYIYILLFLLISALNISAQTVSTNDLLLIQTINEIKIAGKIKDIVLYNKQISSNYLKYLRSNPNEPETITSDMAKEVLIKPLKQNSFDNVIYKDIDINYIVKNKAQVGEIYKLEVEFEITVINQNDIKQTEKSIIKLELDEASNKLWKIIKIE